MAWEARGGPVVQPRPHHAGVRRGELFTGNNLMVLAFAGRKISGRAMLRNWGFVYVANAVGAVLLAFAIHYSGVLDGNGVKATAVKIAEAKAQLDMPTAFLRGMLCNMLVCLAVWLSVAARSVEGKVIAIALPISAFVALGFEHCVANFYLLPIGMLSGAQVTIANSFRQYRLRHGRQPLGGILIAALLYLIYLGKDQVQRSRPTFSQPMVAASASEPVVNAPANAAIVNAPPTQPTTEGDTMRTAEVRLRLKSEHGRPVPR